MMREFGPFLPDQPETYAQPHLRDAQGVLPALNKYTPLPGLSITTSALSAACLGAVAARDILQAAHVFAGDSTKLYQLQAGTWVDFSKVGGYGPATATTRWRSTTFGDRLIKTNGLDTVQYIDMSTAATAFADLAGSPPKALFITNYVEFVFLASTDASSMLLKWSGFGDSEGWTPGTNQSDEQEFADGGRITGLGTTKAALYVFQEKCIRRVLYTGGDTIFQIDKIVDGIGCIEPNSLVQFGQRFFFLDEAGWHQFDGETEPEPIGVEAFDQWFLADSDRASWHLMSCDIDPRRKIVAWAYASTNSVGVCDSILFYNYAIKRPTYVRLSTEIILGAMSLGASWDDAGFSADSWDDADFSTLSWDDPSYLGGTFYLSAFNTDHKLCSFAGSNVAATLETSDFEIAPGKRQSVKWFKPIADTANATIAGASKVRPGDSITYQSAVSQQTSGRCPQRGVNGFYARAKVSIPAAESWTYASGIDLESADVGNR